MTDIKKVQLNSIYGIQAAKFIYADTDSVKYEGEEPMRRIIRECIKVQFDYSDIPLQDRVYIAFGRLVTDKEYDEEGIDFLITNVKSELEFLEGVWNGKDGKG